MPFTIEEKRERKKIKNKEYYEKNKDKFKKYNKEKHQEYYEKNKEYYKNYHKSYYQKNNDKIKKNKQIYRKTPQGKRVDIISNWKSIGIIADNYDEWYEKYLICNECNFCDKKFKNTKDKHLDHNHTINDCENIRGVLCCKCNIKDVFLDLLI